MDCAVGRKARSSLRRQRRERWTSCGSPPRDKGTSRVSSGPRAVASWREMTPCVCVRSLARGEGMSGRWVGVFVCVFVHRTLLPPFHVRSCMHAFMHACIHACIHACATLPLSFSLPLPHLPDAPALGVQQLDEQVAGEGGRHHRRHRQGEAAAPALLIAHLGHAPVRDAVDVLGWVVGVDVLGGGQDGWEIEGCGWDDVSEFGKNAMRQCNDRQSFRQTRHSDRHARLVWSLFFSPGSRSRPAPGRQRRCPAC